MHASLLQSNSSRTLHMALSKTNPQIYAMKKRNQERSRVYHNNRTEKSEHVEPPGAGSNADIAIGAVKIVKNPPKKTVISQDVVIIYRHGESTGYRLPPVPSTYLPPRVRGLSGSRSYD